MPCPNCGSEKIVWGRTSEASQPLQSSQENFSFINSNQETVASLAICENCGIFYNFEKKLTTEEVNSIKLSKERLKELKDNKLKFISNAREK